MAWAVVALSSAVKRDDNVVTAVLGVRAGTANKVPADVREVMADVWLKHAPQVSAWLMEIKDPAKRLDVYMPSLQYTILKLARTEHTVDGSSPIVLLAVEVRTSLHRRIMEVLKVEPKPDGDAGAKVSTIVQRRRVATCVGSWCQFSAGLRR